MGTAETNTPGWVDLGSPDVAASNRFYGELFGWEPNVAPMPEAGGYTVYTKDGKPVAGCGGLMSEGQPPAWSTYVLTDDADAVAARVESAGGKVLVAPFDVMDQGRMAVFLDQAGAAFSVWQPGKMPGAELFNVPGALTWNELTTRDPEGSKAFYSNVFGWGIEDGEYGPVTYTQWQVDGRSMAGMMPMVGDMWPTEMPPHWMVYFAVDDCDATAAKAVELGGSNPVPPTDIPQGRIAVLNDPHGAVFSIIKT